MVTRAYVWLASLALGLLAAGCGGGGGGSSGVTVSRVGPASVNTQVYEGQTVPSVVITAHIDGDLQTINGKPLYIVVVVPDPLFDTRPSVSIGSDLRTVTIQLFGVAAPSGAKTYQNNITLHACLDSGCQTEVGSSNMSLPYTVAVKAGLKLSTSSIALNTTFGTLPSPASVSVTLPDGATSWSVSSQNAGFIKANKANDGSLAIGVSSDALDLPNLNAATADFTVQAATPDGQTLYKTLHVSYSTVSSSLLYAFARPLGASFSVAYGTPTLSAEQSASILVPDASGDKIRYLGATYTWPDAAASNAYRSGWMYFYAPDELTTTRWPEKEYYARVQVQACYSGNCLPAGTYTATLHFRYSPASGATYDLDYPVTMAIAP